MADKKISQLNPATLVNDADLIPIVQSGETKKVTKQILLSGTTSPEWKETILHMLQLNTVGSYGVSPAQVLVLTSNLAVGDTLYFDKGDGSWFAFPCVSDPDEEMFGGFLVQANINATLNRMVMVWMSQFGGSQSASVSMWILDATNNILIMVVPGGSSPARVYGNAGAAAKCKILPAAKAYTGVAADLVSLPSSAPSTTNFGFYRAEADIVINETHITRAHDEIGPKSYVRDENAGQWILL